MALNPLHQAGCQMYQACGHLVLIRPLHNLTPRCRQLENNPQIHRECQTKNQIVLVRMDLLKEESAGKESRVLPEERVLPKKRNKLDSDPLFEGGDSFRERIQKSICSIDIFDD